MKEIGKLIELLNEYEKEENARRLDYGKLHNHHYCDYDYEDEELRVISKKFGFIKRLVENDKIERPEIRSQGYTKPTYGYTTEPYTTCKSIELANTMLMILAIQDEPIRFLCEILK